MIFKKVFYVVSSAVDMVFLVSLDEFEREIYNRVSSRIFLIHLKKNIKTDKIISTIILTM
ncbi:hypothetical protein NH26_19395 [Flammeovirga pacifica]|uniref:Uncharacterized protein n=1 Tax=Flammeovirga pacifica TaxID=915059 RepID=A0A1S1Z4Z4_FLAPC|nr:hypothetical protein NH26_19395 [Flammeovirga pacifica]